LLLERAVLTRIASSRGSSLFVEPLESRQLFAAPQATSVFADNRGEVQITFNQALDPTTVNTRSVFVHLAGADDTFGTADDQKITGRVKLTAGNKRIWYRPAEKVPFAAGSSYSIKVSGKLVKSAGGERIDGEFNGPGVATGNGTAGGDFLTLSKRDKGLNPTVRFSTIAGNFDVRMFGDKTPKNVANFLGYANDGSYDNTFVQRLIATPTPFIWQTGGFTVSPTNTVEQVTAKTPADNEPAPTTATRGTISLARPDDGVPSTDDKGTNQFFFNLANNESNLGSQNGGFTEFGEVTSAAGLAVMDALAAFPTIDGDPAVNPGQFDNLAVQSESDTVDDAVSDPQGTLVTIRRIAVRNKIVAYPL
jgi:cyclophilin family peptidyl-prolyl cis-trans isomerase